MGFFGGWSTVPGIKELNGQIGGLQYNPYVGGAGENRVFKDARAILRGTKGFYDTGLGASMRAGILSDAANNKALEARDLASRYAGTGMYNDAFKNALLTEQNRQSDQATQNALAQGNMQGSQYLVGLNRADRQNQQDYNNQKSMYDLEKLKLQSGNLLQGTQRTGGILGGISGILGLASQFTPAGAFGKLASGAFQGFNPYGAGH